MGKPHARAHRVVKGCQFLKFRFLNRKCLKMIKFRKKKAPKSGGKVFMLPPPETEMFSAGEDGILENGKGRFLSILDRKNIFNEELYKETNVNMNNLDNFLVVKNQKKFADLFASVQNSRKTRQNIQKNTKLGNVFTPLKQVGLHIK